MNYTTEKSTGSFALGLLVGAAAGAGLALLFAPKAGSELRGEIGESVASWKSAAGKKLRNTASSAGSMVDAAIDSSRPDGRSRL